MRPEWLDADMKAMITDLGKAYGLEPAAIAAVITVESDGRPHVTRYEPGWQYWYNAEEHAKRLAITVDTERVHQATSWGYMQVMGAVARQHGFDDQLPTLMFEHNGLAMGCAHLKTKFDTYSKSGLPAIFASYNAGSPHYASVNGIMRLINQQYAERAMAAYVELRKEFGAE